MKLFFVLVATVSTLSVFASVPDVVITTLSSANGHATVGGRLTAKPDGPVGISVRNGNIMYSTITDAEGRWAIVIRHLSTQVFATSWSLTTPSDRGNEVALAASSLPWTRSVSASGSSTSETSAKYQTETSLRWEIDRERSNCGYDKGSFSYSGGFVYCNKSGSTYQCSATASCSCSKK